MLSLGRTVLVRWVKTTGIIYKVTIERNWLTNPKLPNPAPSRCQDLRWVAGTSNWGQSAEAEMPLGLSLKSLKDIRKIQDLLPERKSSTFQLLHKLQIGLSPQMESMRGLKRKTTCSSRQKKKKSGPEGPRKVCLTMPYSSFWWTSKDCMHDSWYILHSANKPLFTNG